MNQNLNHPSVAEVNWIIMSQTELVSFLTDGFIALATFTCTLHSDYLDLTGFLYSLQTV